MWSRRLSFVRVARLAAALSFVGLAAAICLGHAADRLDVALLVLTGALMCVSWLTVRHDMARVEVFDTLVGSMDLGFCVVEMLYDRDGKPIDYRFVEINPAFEVQTGLHRAVGRTMREMVPDHDAHWFEIYGKVAETGEDVRFENSAVAMERYFDVFAFRIGGDGSRRVGILFYDISARKKIENTLILDARYDKLTGLPNSTMFNEYFNMALSRADRNRQDLALLFLDLDKFKEVNDTFGHHVGDVVLKTVAARLLSCMRAGDLVSRLGGDEFTIIVENFQPAQLDHLTEKIIRVIEPPIEMEGRSVKVSASIGVASYPEFGSDPQTLLQKADAAMYAAKKDRRRRRRRHVRGSRVGSRDTQNV